MATAGVSARTAPLLTGLLSWQRSALARSITLVESTLPAHRADARELVQQAIHATHAPGHPLANKSSIRIGLSGSPGVGKSTLIESLGLHAISQGHRVAVLAVDPSSVRSGGSILGDKTRMVDLSRHDNAYVRPTPTGGSLGGVARNTNEAIILCEAAGFDVVLVETVGVGQSETMVADMVDMFVLLVPPAGGDELQGIKRGIMEMADLIIVTKADGDLVNAAQSAQLEYTSALKFLAPKTDFWRPKVISISSVKKQGIEAAWGEMAEYNRLLTESGTKPTLRGEQRKTWMWRMVHDQLISMLEHDASVLRSLERMSEAVFNGKLDPGHAADELVSTFAASLRGSS